MKENLDQPEIKTSEGFKGFFDILESFIYAIIAVILIFVFFAKLTVVEQNSMETTLHDKDYLVVVNPLFTYKPETGDIVIIHDDFDGEYYDDPIVKRVIATEGQTIKIVYNFETITCDVYVDNVLFQEPEGVQYIDSFTQPTAGWWEEKSDGEPEFHPYYDSATETFTATVPEGCVFVLGDNRNHSADSRLAEIGFIDVDNILGKAVFRILPFNGFGSIE